MSSKKVPFNRHKEKEEARRKVSDLDPFQPFPEILRIFYTYVSFLSEINCSGT
jgi:hypothetical protein